MSATIVMKVVHFNTQMHGTPTGQRRKLLRLWVLSTQLGRKLLILTLPLNVCRSLRTGGSRIAPTGREKRQVERRDGKTERERDTRIQEPKTGKQRGRGIHVSNPFQTGCIPFQTGCIPHFRDMYFS